MIDLASLRNAIASLDEALAAHQERPGDHFIRDAAIQRFEYTYELAHRMLRRYLQATEPAADVVQGLSFPDLIRLGWERGLLRSEWSVWRGFRDHRNITSHAYDENKAKLVFNAIPAFRDEARALLDAIDARQKRP